MRYLGKPCLGLLQRSLCSLCARKQLSAAAKKRAHTGYFGSRGHARHQLVDVGRFPLKLACQAPKVRLGAGKLGPAFGQVCSAGTHLDAPFMELLNIFCTQQQRFVVREGCPFFPGGFELLGQGLDASRCVCIIPLGCFQRLACIFGKRRHLTQRRNTGVQLGFSPHIPIHATNAAQLA